MKIASYMNVYKVRLTTRLKRVLFRLGLYAVIRKLFPRQAVAVLRYHAVCPPGVTYASKTISVTPEGFRKQVRYLASRYPILPLDEVVERLQKGETVPSNAIAITFDDGYQDNYLAFQILQEYGATATFFITTNCIDDQEVFWVSEVRHLIMKTAHANFNIEVRATSYRFELTSPLQREAAVSAVTQLIKSCTIVEREAVRMELRNALDDIDPKFDGTPLMLSSEQIRNMLSGGMSIGGHTLTHANLPSAGLQDATYELIECRHELERQFALTTTAMAYPNGGATEYVTDEVQRLAQEAGYSSAWTSKHGYVTPATDLYHGPRIEVTESLAALIHLMEGDRLIEALKR